MLMPHHPALLEVLHVVEIDAVLIKHDPADVAIPKAPFTVVGIEVGVRMGMMLPVLGGPAERRLFKGARREKKQQKADERACLERCVSEEPVITDRDRKAGGQKIKPEKGGLSRGESVMIDIKRRPDEPYESHKGNENNSCPPVTSFRRCVSRHKTFS